MKKEANIRVIAVENNEKRFYMLEKMSTPSEKHKVEEIHYNKAQLLFRTIMLKVALEDDSEELMDKDIRGFYTLPFDNDKITCTYTTEDNLDVLPEEQTIWLNNWNFFNIPSPGGLNTCLKMTKRSAESLERTLSKFHNREVKVEELAL